MEEFAKGVGAHGREVISETVKSIITDIDFRFSSKFCSISISINNQPPQLFKIKYEEENFQIVLGGPIKALGLGLLDFTSVNNLYQIKLVDQLLIKTLKKGMQLINKFKAKEIYETSVDKSIQALVNNANEAAAKLGKDLDERFSKIIAIVEEVQMEVYDRSQLINKAKDELLDNLNRKYILVVNQLIELQREHAITESNLSKQVEELINNL